MRKLGLVNNCGVTLEDGCAMYLDNCRQRNLRDGTISHYKQSYNQFFKFFGRETPLSSFDSTLYGKYVLYLKSTLDNDVSINSYLRDLITTLHFLMDEGYVEPFKM